MPRLEALTLTLLGVLGDASTIDAMLKLTCDQAASVRSTSVLAIGKLYAEGRAAVAESSEMPDFLSERISPTRLSPLELKRSKAKTRALERLELGF